MENYSPIYIYFFLHKSKHERVGVFLKEMLQYKIIEVLQTE